VADSRLSPLLAHVAYLPHLPAVKTARRPAETWHGRLVRPWESAADLAAAGQAGRAAANSAPEKVFHKEVSITANMTGRQKRSKTAKSDHVPVKNDQKRSKSARFCLTYLNIFALYPLWR